MNGHRKTKGLYGLVLIWMVLCVCFVLKAKVRAQPGAGSGASASLAASVASGQKGSPGSAVVHSATTTPLAVPVLTASESASVDAATVAASGSASASTFAASSGTSPTPVVTPSEEEDDVPRPVVVEVGMYVVDIAKLDMKDSEFFADFYIWYKIDPAASGAWSPEAIEFTNGTLESASTPVFDVPTDGKIYWSQRIKGRFRSKFNLHRYPFDTQYLPITLEDRESAESKVVFVPAQAAPKDYRLWCSKDLEVPDWTIAGVDLKVRTHHYATDFGLNGGRRDSKESMYSSFTLEFKLERLFIPHMIKFLIPLMVIAGMAYMVFFINAKEFESQCAICVTSLLSAVALHISQADALPAVGYLVVADKMFILFYLVIFSALVQTVAANNYAKTGNIEMAARLDRVFQVIFPGALMVGAAIITWLS
jgi:hypothetical protein